jgi:hypothetical protein
MSHGAVPASRCRKNGTTAHISRERCEALEIVVAQRVGAGQRHLKRQHLVDEAIDDLLAREDAKAALSLVVSE